MTRVSAPTVAPTAAPIVSAVSSFGEGGALGVALCVEPGGTVGVGNVDAANELKATSAKLEKLAQRFPKLVSTCSQHQS